MDHESFDRLARLLARPGSRRTALGTALSAGLLGSGLATAKNRHRQKGKDKVKGQAKKSGPRSCPSPKPGQNLSKCDFAGADLSGKSLRGANLSGASLAGANLCGADLRGANLSKVDFQNANLTRTDLRGTNLSTAKLAGVKFCQTKRPDGTLDDTHCPPEGVDVCCAHAECEGPSGRCVAGACASESCSDDLDCQPPGRCINGACVTRTCTRDADCAPHGDKCVNGLCDCNEFGDCLHPDAPLCCPGASFGCVDPNVDHQHCGQCGHFCPSGLCAGGTCQARCSSSGQCNNGDPQIDRSCCAGVCIGHACCATGDICEVGDNCCGNGIAEQNNRRCCRSRPGSSGRVCCLRGHRFPEIRPTKCDKDSDCCSNSCINHFFWGLICDGGNDDTDCLS